MPPTRKEKLTFGELADSVSVTHSFSKPELIFLNTSDIHWGRVLHRNYTAVATWPGQAKKSIRKGDILFSEIRPANGRYAFVDFDAEDYVVSTKLMVIRPRPGKVSPRFLYHFLTSRKVAGWLQHLAESRSGTFPQITFEQVAELELPQLELEEQQAIAALLDALDQKIEHNRRTARALERLARAIFRAWFLDFEPVKAKASGATAFPSMPQEVFDTLPTRLIDSEIGPVPEGWKVGVVSDLGTVICGKTPPTKARENFGNEIPFITIPDMHGKVFVTETVRSLSLMGANTQAKKFLPEKSICVSCIATPGLVVLNSKPAQTNQQINSVIPGKNTSPYYCYELLSRLGDRIRSGGSGGSVFHNLNKTSFSRLPVLLASESSVRGFHNQVASLFESILGFVDETGKLAEMRDYLLPRLLSGQVRVEEAVSTSCRDM